MKSSFLRLGFLAALLVAPLGLLNVKGEKKSGVALAYANLRLSFIENQGQIDEKVKFYLKASNHSIFFTKGEIVYSFPVKEGKSFVMRQKFVGANHSPILKAFKKALGKVNYLVGDKTNWKTNISTYEEVVYKNLYPGIDLVFSGTNGRLKSEYRIAAGADLKRVLVAYDGIDSMRMTDTGDLILKNKGGELKEERLYIYQVIDGKKIEVKGRYALGKNQYGFEVESYDSKHELVVDPDLIYSTFLGGSGIDVVTEIAVDRFGNAYVTGSTTSSSFPTTPGAFDVSYGGGSISGDAFVIKLNPFGSVIY